MRTAEALAVARRLYREADGFEIPPADERVVARSKGSSTYGELMPTATARMLAALELGRDDVFFDLGAGVGKVVLLAALLTEVGQAVGVELASRRVALGCRVLDEARREQHPGADRAALIEADMLRCELEAATVIYTCSTAFSSTFMRRLVRRLATLPKLRTFVSLQDIDDHPAFELVDTLSLDASWRRRAKAHVYART
jgi:hypothetical protein